MYEIYLLRSVSMNTNLYTNTISNLIYTCFKINAKISMKNTISVISFIFFTDGGSLQLFKTRLHSAQNASTAADVRQAETRMLLR